VVTDTSGRYAPDTVIGQSVPRGDYVDEGTQIDMEISGTASYSYSARIEAPRRSEDPNYVEGTAVTLLIVTSDGETILNKTTTEFPYPVSFTGISCPTGTLYFNYTNIVNEVPQTGMTSTEDGPAEYDIPMEITEPVEFTRELTFTPE
jgi:beta-lactam-binding protein with PASTA domain